MYLIGRRYRDPDGEVDVVVSGYIGYRMACDELRNQSWNESLLACRSDLSAVIQSLYIGRSGMTAI